MSFFEGTEKKLEIILNNPKPEIRKDERIWDKVVKSAYTNIISKISNKWFDAYLLSESSLFVYDDRIILITCGNSKPYKSLPMILNYISKNDISYIFYERKNFIAPDRQTTFKEEISIIEEIVNGKSYKIGPDNEDHIYLFYSNVNPINLENTEDTTLEILMHDIPPDIGNIYYFDNNTKEFIREKSGISNIIKDNKILYDDYLFEPCGYSLNSLYNKGYFTIHVTPQTECSYVSFESNISFEDAKDYNNIINNVLECFKPSRFTLVITSNKKDLLEKEYKNLYCSDFIKTSYERLDIGDYRILFANFKKKDILRKKQLYNSYINSLKNIFCISRG